MTHSAKEPRCRTLGCGRPELVRGLCRRCFDKETGRPECRTQGCRNSPLRSGLCRSCLAPAPEKCDAPGCSRDTHLRGLCSTHLYRYGGRICSVPDCDSPHRAKGLCGKHYEAKRRGPPKPRHETCTEPGCDSPHLAKGLCSAHYQRQRRVSQKQRRAAMLANLEKMYT